MQLGMTLAEYERSVGPINKYYHELAEARYLQRQRVIPYDDEDESGDTTVSDPSETKMRGTSASNFTDGNVRQ